MNQDIIEKLASDMIDTAIAETQSEPLMKHASAEAQTDNVASKIAATYNEAEEYKEAAIEAFGTAEQQEKLAYEALVENGIDPDSLLEEYAE